MLYRYVSLHPAPSTLQQIMHFSHALALHHSPCRLQCQQQTQWRQGSPRHVTHHTAADVIKGGTVSGSLRKSTYLPSKWTVRSGILNPHNPQSTIWHRKPNKHTTTPCNTFSPGQRHIVPYICTVYKLGVHDWDSFLVCTAGESVDVYTVSCAVKDYNRRTSSYSKSCCLAIHQVREGL